MGPDKQTGVRPFNCIACQDPESLQFLDETTRRAWHCGWLSEEEWLCEVAEFPSHANYTGDVCPGRLMSLPIVREAEIAVIAFRAGQLSVFYPGREAAVLIATMELNSAVSQYEREQLETPR
jgi:hypothetical protein